MNALPAEIYDIIFSFACADGGRTGCSLSLVSHHISAVSARMRYQSVALFGCQALLSFSTLAVERIRKNETLFIRELYLTDATPQDPTFLSLPFAPASPIWYHSRYRESSDDSGDGDSDGKPGDAGGWWENWIPTTISHILHGPAVRRAHVRGVNGALADILSACAPSLRALTLSMQTPPLFTLVPVHLPALERLALLIGPHLVAAQDSGPDPAPPLPRALPALRYLDLLTFPLATWSDDAFARLLNVTPALTRLRVGIEPELVPVLHRYLPPELSETIDRIELHYINPLIGEPLVRRWRGSRDQVHLVHRGEWFVGQRTDYYIAQRGALDKWISGDSE